MAKLERGAEAAVQVRKRCLCEEAEGQLGAVFCLMGCVKPEVPAAGVPLSHQCRDGYVLVEQIISWSDVCT